jgi:hypothetical protein
VEKFLDTYDPPKLNQEDINNLDQSIMSNDTEAVIKILPIKKSPGPDGLPAEIYQTFRELTPMNLKLLHDIEREGTLPNSLFKANVTLI